MPRATIGEIELDHEVHGAPDGEPLLLIAGLAEQRISWPDEFIEGLVERGLRVITFDNRDVGRSSWLDDAGLPRRLAEAVRGRRRTNEEPAYTLGDMADDAAGLLDHLGIEQAHVLGVSMGGMIAQRLAIRHPHRLLSLTSVMSTTGGRGVGQASDEALAQLTTPTPSERSAYIEHAVASSRIWAGPLYDEARRRARAAAEFDRAYHPAGVARQLHAIQFDRDRAPALAALDIPTLVIHGETDTLIAPSGGRATADAIPGARLWLHPEMGHELSAPLVEELSDLVADHVHAAAGSHAGR